MKAPFPPKWLEILVRNVPYYRMLPRQDKQELQGLVQVLLAEKHFEGLGGMTVTDEVRVTIAAHACILLLRRKTEFYPLLVSVLVYPETYVAPMQTREPGGVVSEGMQALAGQTWDKGSLVLSWGDVLRGASNVRDGRNVVFHEFAHQLDNEAGVADGAPLLPNQTAYEEWARVCRREYRALVQDIEHGRPTVIDGYAATSPAEFFAVVTELFFEGPVQLKARHPELYALFKSYYQQDPATLAVEAGRARW